MISKELCVDGYLAPAKICRTLVKGQLGELGFCEDADPICIYIWGQCYLGKDKNQMQAKILSRCYVCFADGLLLFI